MVDMGTMATVASVFNIVGFAGSLRCGSYNRALLRAATELAPPAGHLVHEATREVLATFLQRFTRSARASR